MPAALIGFGITMAISRCWHPLLVTRPVILGTGVPTVLIAAGLAVLYRGSVVPGSRYCNRCIGAWVETLGLFVRPGISLWYRLAFPLALAIVGVLGLAPMLLGFDDLGLGAFDHLLWFLIATAFLWLGFALTRFVVARTSVGWGITVLLLFGLGIPGLVFYCWPEPKIAILLGECVILFPALAAVVLGEHRKKGKSRRDSYSGAVAWFLVAVLIVLTPGIGRWFEENTENRRSWHLAQIPFERSFHVEASSWVCAKVALADTRRKLDLRLRHEDQIVAGQEISAWKGWLPAEPGDYTLEVTAGNLRVKPSQLSFVVAEGYATAVAFMAHELLVSKGKTPKPSMPGAFTLELVTQAESCPHATTTPGSPDARAETSRAR
ncbi:MAG: hypothetical protein HC897_00985 [Thermoanaerobaculia bacterium]|nr:hypothetical protein [Thermoanaerobaculia bacterium]